ncbi:YheC/YheD family protein [Ornithinibacillus sp. BX22]|uniref:YheC/YheD family protein n=2 Tax=Ornithinibacillus TaxID=484508 RepID=A0A923L7Q3_9BACI|nr:MULTISPECIES: YheC/YheD family protein [Ornithinibacillus]MBC5637937.1 YheC/YheD family protein [Ornithinibacillus hominis]MBS3681699.1 YheC/YheD family protein [Ornithinibacillus massiliensis]
MTKLEENTIFQVKNIIDTLIEATSHFSKLVKQKELNQCIFMFSSIVDGVTAIEKVTANSNLTLGQKEKKKIENTLLLIAQELETNNLIKIAEIIQFSLMPLLKQWQKEFEVDEIGLLNKDITIGVYLSESNPRIAYPKPRIDALVEEAEKQGVTLLFFSSSGVNMDAKQVTGEVFQNGKWQEVTSSFPNVIHNIGIASRERQTITERKLRREVPFTSFGVGNKFYLPKIVVENRKFAELLVPFKIITDEDRILEFLNENQKGVLKPIMGRQGLFIYYVEKNGNHFIIHEDKKERILGKEKFTMWIQDVILKNKNSYMIQKYIHARTNAGEPFDIRAHVQKNNEGKWQITKIYPRIGNKKSILSNISRGGRTQELDVFLTNEYGAKGKQYAEELRKLSLDITYHLDKLYGLVLDELGLDLAIDKNGRFWLHEVNNGPQSTYHEKERAINTIGYAIYIAKNGIFLTNSFQKQSKSIGNFDSRNSNLEWAELDNRVSIGMLVQENEINNLTIACAYVAKYENVHFFYFTPKDIDYDEMCIRGYFYQNKEWVPMIVNYPDVIYDRLRARGIEGFHTVYEELEGIPFTNQFYGNSISKLEVYDKLSAIEQLSDIMIPYQKVNRLKDIFHYIQEYGSVILKPEVGSFAKGVRYIEKLNIDRYRVADGENVNELSELSLSKYIRDVIKKGTFIVQKYIETRTKEGNPFDIRVHMMKDGNGEWSFVNKHPRIGTNYATITVFRSGGYVGELVAFLNRNYSQDKSSILVSKIEERALNIASEFDALYENKISELGIDLAIDKDLNIYLIEVNVNKPGIVYYEFEVAKHAIPYAKYLSQKNSTNNQKKMETF